MVNLETAREYQVKSYPTLLYFKQEVVGKFSGARSKEHIVSFMGTLQQESEYTIVTTSTEYTEQLAAMGDYFFLLYVPYVNSLSPRAVAVRADWLEQYRRLARWHHMNVHFLLFVPSGQEHNQPALTDAHHRSTMIRIGSQKKLLGSAEEGDAVPLLFKMEPRRKPIPLHFPEGPVASTLDAALEENSHRFIVSLDSHNFKRMGSLNHTMCLLVTGGPGPATDRLISLFDAAVSSLHPSEYYHRTAFRGGAPEEEEEEEVATKGGGRGGGGCCDRPLLFGTIDGVRWRSFFKQYESDRLPVLLLLDLRRELYLATPLITSTVVKHSPDQDGQVQQETRREIEAVLNGYLASTLLFKHYEPPGFIHRIVQRLREKSVYTWLLVLPLIFLLTSLFVTPHPDHKKKMMLKKHD